MSITYIHNAFLSNASKTILSPASPPHPGRVEAVSPGRCSHHVPARGGYLCLLPPKKLNRYKIFKNFYLEDRTACKCYRVIQLPLMGNDEKILDKVENGYYTCTINNTSVGDIMRIINFSEARNNLKSVLDQVADDADYTIITRRDSENAVVMSLETFNSFMETFYLLRSPANAAHLTKSIEQYREGKIQERDLINE